VRNILILLITALLFTACNNDSDKAIEVDVSNVSIPELPINRLEQDIFNFDTANVFTYTKNLEQKYGTFYKTYIRSIINNGGIRDSSYSLRIKQFINDYDMRNAYKDCNKNYSDITFLKTDVEAAFKRFKALYPQKQLPKVITMMSGFNYSVITVDSTLGIGLEMYLGTDNMFYKMLALPYYKRKYMNKENIVPDAMRAWMMDEFKYNMESNDFLNQIVFIGKIMYITDALLPEVSDSLKIQYSKKQLEYCTQNEFNMWSYFVAQKVLYSTDQAQIMKFTSDGPFTSAFSKNSAPRVGYWIGWQIVKQFMKNNPNETITQLMNESNAQIVLTKAKYKPKKQ
jgi:hypothetical protein